MPSFSVVRFLSLFSQGVYFRKLFRYYFSRYIIFCDPMLLLASVVKSPRIAPLLAECTRSGRGPLALQSAGSVF